VSRAAARLGPPGLPGDDQAPLLVDQLRRRRQPVRPARERGCRSRPLPDPAPRGVSPRIARALRAMSGLARLAPTSSRLFAPATAGQFIFGIVLALPGTLFGTPAWTTAVGCDVAAQANLLVVFFTGPLTCTAAAGL